MEKYQIPLIVDTKVMSVFTPYQMIGYVILMDILAFAVIGMLLYTLSLYVRRVGAYIVTILLIFFSTMVNYLDAGAKLGLIYFSPFSWENVGNWRYGYDLSKPNFCIYLCRLFSDSVSAGGCRSETDSENRLDKQGGIAMAEVIKVEHN